MEKINQAHLSITSASSSSPICLRTELGKEFIRRCKLNSAYSMRAFAKHLDIDQSLLSKILKEQRNISLALAEKLVQKLKIKPSQANQILLAQVPGLAAQINANYEMLADDHVALLENWSHFAILELIKTKNFRYDVDTIAQRLSIHPLEVKEAIARLVRLKYINISGKKIKLLKPDNTWTNTVATTFARQELQKSLLEKAKNAIETIPFELRENGSLTVAIKISRMSEFKQKLAQIRKELDAFIQPQEDVSEFDEVYQLTLAFFPLTKTLKKLKK